MSNQDAAGPPEGWIITVRTERPGGGPRLLEVWGAWMQDEMAGLDLLRDIRVLDAVVETRHPGLVGGIISERRAE